MCNSSFGSRGSHEICNRENTNLSNRCPGNRSDFFTGRVYQGAEGYIYPYPLYDILTEKKIEKDYNVLRLNNQYVDIAILPEIGGRIFAASDKTNDYPFSTPKQE